MTATVCNKRQTEHQSDFHRFNYPRCILKVLHIMSSCPLNSGVAHVVMRYYRELHEKITFDFLLFRDLSPSFREEIEALGGTVFTTGKPSIKTLGKFRKTLNQFFSEHASEYEAVHLHEVYMAAFVLPVAKKHGIKILISHSHTTDYSDKKLSALRNRLLYALGKKHANTYVGCSKAAGITAFGNDIVSNPSFYVLKNPFDTQSFAFSEDNRQKIRAELGLSPDDFVVGHIGRFSPQKNHSFLIDIFSELVKLKPCAKLVLVGEGRLMEETKEKCNRLGISERVIFCGHRKDTNAVLSAFDYFCFPSVFEGLGLVLIEAQANGLPILTSTTIADEAKVLPSYKQFDLSDGPAKWTRTLAESAARRDTDALRLIADAGFDIRREAHQYIEMLVTQSKRV